MTFNFGRVCLSHYLSLKKGCKDKGHAKEAKNNRGTEVLRSTMKVNTCHSTLSAVLLFLEILMLC